MATGLLGGVLPYIYSRADALKRTLGDVVSNPMASTEQAVNYANDRARYLNQLNAQVSSQGVKGLMSPQGQELANIYTEAYNPVGMTAKNLSYRGSHTAPSSEFGAPLYDLTGGGQMYPADVYSSKAAQYYGGGVPYDQKAFSIAQQYKDKPDALVTIYRAVPKQMSVSEKLAEIEKQMAAYMRRGTLPKDAENYSSGSKWYDNAYEMRDKLRQMTDEMPQGINDINAGDWVTLTREYAKDHGESALGGQYKIISKKVKAKEVYTNADSIHEFGYSPESVTKQTPTPIESPAFTDPFANTIGSSIR
jgi:hypothetical protein